MAKIISAVEEIAAAGGPGLMPILQQRIGRIAVQCATAEAAAAKAKPTLVFAPPPPGFPPAGPAVLVSVQPRADWGRD